MTDTTNFDDLGIPAHLVETITQLGYEQPSPIQAAAIPVGLEGQDFIAQAQTGTGKTAAFALPILTKINSQLRQTQCLVLAPTRELAIQVAESFKSYAKQMPEFHVLAVYGGSDYRTQLKALKRGAQVVVGTPGRVMDHIRRGSLTLDHIQALILDEADEMLNMGFVEDVEWVLSQIPQEHQTALFSATMPKAIQGIADKYLQNPKHIKIKAKTSTVTAIEQQGVIVKREHKFPALVRFLEADSFEAAIIFTRTKLTTTEVADKLEARGYAAAAINGDMAQNLREKVIGKLKKGKLDIVVATDVAARGLDVERIGLVINYDIPQDAETYVHRIGRTGRAGRTGRSLLFVAPRERRMLNDIERTTKQKIAMVTPPSLEAIKTKRDTELQQYILQSVTQEDHAQQQAFIAKLQQDNPQLDLQSIAATLLSLLQQASGTGNQEEDIDFADVGSFRSSERSSSKKGKRSRAVDETVEEGMTRCVLDVGRNHRISPKDIVGFIANQGGTRGKNIGAIQLFDRYSWVDIKTEQVKKVVRNIHHARLKKYRVQAQIMS